VFEFPVSISRDRWWGSTLLSKWQNSDAPHYIRLAAFLSAVNPSVSCSGSWYPNVILEPPTNLQLQQLHRLRPRHRSHRCSYSIDNMNVAGSSAIWHNTFVTSCLPVFCFSCSSMEQCTRLSCHASMFLSAVDITHVRAVTSTGVTCHHEL